MRVQCMSYLHVLVFLPFFEFLKNSTKAYHHTNHHHQPPTSTTSTTTFLEKELGVHCPTSEVIVLHEDGSASIEGPVLEDRSGGVQVHWLHYWLLPWW